MDDLTCHVCNALVTPVGQADGVFCPHVGCPGERLCRFDAMNVCRPNPFCLSLSGGRVSVMAQEPGATPPPAVEPKKKKPKPVPKAGPDLFEAMS